MQPQAVPSQRRKAAVLAMMRASPAGQYSFLTILENA
jgi:hypothetical protein